MRFGKPSAAIKCRSVLRVVLVVVMCSACGNSFAQDIDPWRLRAVFLYNFSQFIEWPSEAFSDPAGSFNICILGQNRFGSTLQALEKRPVRGHPIAIFTPRQLSESHSCHILYVTDLRVLSGDEWPTSLGRTSVLTIVDADNSRNVSAGIGFVEQGGKLRWVINLGELRQRNLKVSAKLIEIAVSVIGE